MALSIQFSDEQATPYTAWFMYGGTGSGKTRAASTFPDPLFLVPANEGSQLTLKQIEGRKIPFLLIGKSGDAMAEFLATVSELERLYHAMIKGFTEAGKIEDAAERAAAEKAAADLFPWQTIVVESISHLNDLLIGSITGNGRKKMDQQGWGILANFYTTLHSRLRNMDVHIVYTALAKSETNDEGGIIGGAPMLSGGTAVKLPSMCDVIVYMEELDGGKDAKGNKLARYAAFFRKYRVWPARTRFAGFPDSMDNFDFAKLAGLIA